MFETNDAADIIGWQVVDLFSDDRLNSLADVVQRVADAPGETEECSARRRDGSEFHVEVNSALITDENEVITGRMASFVDVTTRKEAEECRRATEERLRAVLNTAVDAMVNIDRRGIITDINPATEQLFGYAEGELIGQNIKKLMPVHYATEIDRFIAKCLENGNAGVIAVNREAMVKHKNGLLFPADLRFRWVEQLGQFTGVIRDMRERKRLQREVLHAADDRQYRIGQELHGGIQQELVGLEMLAETLLENLAAQSVAINDCQLAERIVEGLMKTRQDVQAIGRGLIQTRISAGELWHSLSQLAHRTNQLKNVACTFDCRDWVTVADDVTATHLYCIAQEAITNALKHGHAAHVTMTLQDEGDDIALSIADDGSGLKPSRKVDGMGLKTMRYRASLIGAALTVRRGESGGTLLTCKVFREGEPS